MEKTVTVSFVNPPKAGGKRWSIKTSDNEYIGFDNQKLSFTKGNTYRLVCSENEYNGRVYLNAESILETVTVPAKASGLGAQVSDRWWLPCVSNTLAHATTAGFIDDPEKIKVWAAAVKQALEELDQPPGQEPF